MCYKHTDILPIFEAAKTDSFYQCLCCSQSSDDLVSLWFHFVCNPRENWDDSTLSEGSIMWIYVLTGSIILTSWISLIWQKMKGRPYQLIVRDSLFLVLVPSSPFILLLGPGFGSRECQLDCPWPGLWCCNGRTIYHHERTICLFKGENEMWRKIAGKKTFRTVIRYIYWHVSLSLIKKLSAGLL